MRVLVNKIVVDTHTSYWHHILVHQTCSPFPLSASHPGSVATTPAAPVLDSGGFLRPGTTTNLPATICQESDGENGRGRQINGRGGGGRGEMGMMEELRQRKALLTCFSSSREVVC